jgi:hypothetical protein
MYILARISSLTFSSSCTMLTNTIRFCCKMQVSVWEFWRHEAEAKSWTSSVHWLKTIRSTWRDSTLEPWQGKPFLRVWAGTLKYGYLAGSICPCAGSGIWPMMVFSPTSKKRTWIVSSTTYNRYIWEWFMVFQIPPWQNDFPWKPSEVERTLRTIK